MRYIYICISLLMALSLTSCFNDDDSGAMNSYWMDYATVDSLAPGVYSLHLDNGKSLWPVMQEVDYSPRERERVFLNYTLLKNSVENEGYDYYIKVNNINRIETKPYIIFNEDISDSLGYAPNTIEKIDVAGMFVNIKFSYRFSHNYRHQFTLARNFSKEDKNQLYFEFRRNSDNDSENYKTISNIAFDILPLVSDIKDSIEVIIENIGLEDRELHKLMYRNIDTIKPEIIKIYEQN